LAQFNLFPTFAGLGCKGQPSGFLYRAGVCPGTPGVCTDVIGGQNSSSFCEPMIPPPVPTTTRVSRLPPGVYGAIYTFSDTTCTTPDGTMPAALQPIIPGACQLSITTPGVWQKISFDDTTITISAFSDNNCTVAISPATPIPRGQCIQPGAGSQIFQIVQGRSTEPINVVRTFLTDNCQGQVNAFNFVLNSTAQCVPPTGGVCQNTTAQSVVNSSSICQPNIQLPPLDAKLISQVPAGEYISFIVHSDNVCQTFNALNLQPFRNGSCVARGPIHLIVKYDDTTIFVETYADSNCTQSISSTPTQRGVCGPSQQFQGASVIANIIRGGGPEPLPSGVQPGKSTQPKPPGPGGNAITYTISLAVIVLAMFTLL
jgi:hypothetical protein